MTTPPPQMIRDLRTELANAIADFKAYDVPGVCKRLGLADGDGSEAFNSEYKYAMSSLTVVPAEGILPMAKKLLQEVSSYRLSEQVAKLEEIGQPAITEITRRRLLSVFKARPLATEMEEVEFVPVAEIPSPYGSSCGILDDIYQHTVRNYDWETDEMLIHLGFLTCSQAQLFRSAGSQDYPVIESVSGDRQGFSFAHMQNFSRKGDKGGRTVSFVLSEASRRSLGLTACVLVAVSGCRLGAVRLRTWSAIMTVCRLAFNRENVHQ